MRALPPLTVAVAVTVALAATPAPPQAGAADPAPGPPQVPVVLAPATPGAGPAPDRAGLRAALRPLIDDDLGRRVGIEVIDVATGSVLYDRGATTGIAPASTTKLLTAAAVLATLDPQVRLATRVVRRPDPAASSPDPAASSPGPAASSPGPAASSPGPAASASTRPRPAEIVLVGGGDAMLTSLPADSDRLADYPPRASLDTLAADTAAALREDGVTRVRLGYDTSLFTGRTAAAEWEPGYTSSVVGPVTALSVNQGRVAPGARSRVPDPAAAGAALFADLLAEDGLTVVGDIDRTTTTASGRGSGFAPVASVESAPMVAVIDHMLTTSDNDVAEALARQVAIAAGRPASFTGAAAATLAALDGFGLGVRGVELYDGSGLSRQDRIPPETVARLLALVAGPGGQRLRPIVEGLPVAGFSGTLDDRFGVEPQSAAAGYLRAKTGHLTGVSTLAGLVPTADGRLLSFDLAADKVAPDAGLDAEAALDRIAARLATCGCRSSPTGGPAG